MAYINQWYKRRSEYDTMANKTNTLIICYKITTKLANVWDGHVIMGSSVGNPSVGIAHLLCALVQRPFHLRKFPLVYSALLDRFAIRSTIRATTCAIQEICLFDVFLNVAVHTAIAQKTNIGAIRENLSDGNGDGIWRVAAGIPWRHCHHPAGTSLTRKAFTWDILSWNILTCNVFLAAFVADKNNAFHLGKHNKYKLREGWGHPTLATVTPNGVESVGSNAATWITCTCVFHYDNKRIERCRITTQGRCKVERITIYVNGVKSTCF
jgi:hypothetical protein